MVVHTAVTILCTTKLPPPSLTHAETVCDTHVVNAARWKSRRVWIPSRCCGGTGAAARRDGVSGHRRGEDWSGRDGLSSRHYDEIGLDVEYVGVKRAIRKHCHGSRRSDWKRVRLGQLGCGNHTIGLVDGGIYGHVLAVVGGIALQIQSDDLDIHRSSSRRDWVREGSDASHNRIG